MDEVRHSVRPQLHRILCEFLLLKLFLVVCAQFFHRGGPRLLYSPLLLLFSLLGDDLVLAEGVDAFARVVPHFLLVKLSHQQGMSALLLLPEGRSFLDILHGLGCIGNLCHVQIQGAMLLTLFT